MKRETNVFFDRLAEQFERRPWWPALAILLLSLPAAWGLGSLEFDGSPQNVFATDSADYRFFREVLREFGSDDGDCLLLVSAENLFSPEPLEGLRELVRRAETVEGVEDVWSIVPLLPAEGSSRQVLERAAKRLRAHPLGGHLIAASAETTLVVVRLESARDVLEEFEPPVRQLDKVSREVAGRYGLTVSTTGIPPLRVEIFRAVQGEAATFMAAGAVLALLTSLVVFRRMHLVIISTVGPLLGAFWTLGGMGLVGQPLNVINVVLPTLVVAVGLTNAIHLVIHIRREIAEGSTASQAAADALRRLGAACLLAAGTTAVGFGSLVASQAGIIRQFAMVCAGGVMLSFLAVLLSVPLLSMWLLRGQAPERLRRPYRLPLALDLLTRRLLGHAPSVVVTGVLLTGGLALSAFALRPDSQLSETIPRDRPSYRTLERCNEQFGGAVQLMVVVQWPEDLAFASPEVLQALQGVERVLERHEVTRYPLSILNVLRTIPGPDGDFLWKARLAGGLPDKLTGRFVRVDTRRAIVVARMPDLGCAAYQRVFEELEGELAQVERVPGLRATLTGTPVLASRNINQMIVDLARSLSLAVVVIFLIITLAFRSWRLGLISVIPNMFPLAATSALLVVTGRPLQLSSVLVFTICLGIAVDDTIHYLNRFVQERRQCADLSLALRRCSAAVGTALVTSTLVLLAAFGSLLASEIPTTRVFAELACVAIAAALVGDLVFLPALLRCFAANRPSGSSAPAAGPQPAPQVPAS